MDEAAWQCDKLEFLQFIQVSKCSSSISIGHVLVSRLKEHFAQQGDVLILQLQWKMTK